MGLWEWHSCAVVSGERIPDYRSSGGSLTGILGSAPYKKHTHGEGQPGREYKTEKGNGNPLHFWGRNDYHPLCHPQNLCFIVLAQRWKCHFFTSIELL